jgi:hypothetical protein
LPSESAQDWLAGKNVFEHARLVLDHPSTLKTKDGDH